MTKTEVAIRRLRYWRDLFGGTFGQELLGEIWQCGQGTTLRQYAYALDCVAWEDQTGMDPFRMTEEDFLRQIFGDA
jgi:hypothetical protein